MWNPLFRAKWGAGAAYQTNSIKGENKETGEQSSSALALVSAQ